MYKARNFIPEGVEDINYTQFSEMERLKGVVSDVFKTAGYNQIQTPTFEYYDLFTGIDVSMDKDQMYKIIDSNGKILVLRPDATIPIARMVATNYETLNTFLKYMYFSTVYRSANFHAGEKREFVQAGIEYYGDPSTDADAEVVCSAIKALTECGFQQLKVELGNANYFNAILDGLSDDLDKETKKEIRIYIESKNTPALGRLLEQLTIEDSYKDVLLKLPFLFGPVNQILDEAFALSLNDAMRSAVLDLKDIYGKINSAELGSYIIADMGLINHLDYYSGMIFKIYLQNTGMIAGSGGRYDGLMKKFGKNIPATGFGLNMNILYEAAQVDSKMEGPLNIALGKGRLADITMEKLEKIGIVFPDFNKNSRKLIFEDLTGDVRIVFVKAGDVDIYVEKGACDIGVAGKDTLMESSSDVFELLDLGYGKCRFAVAALTGFEKKSHTKIRVATKYPNVAKAYFEQKGQPIEIIRINGSVELAPIMGLADVIVDIVETGTTLKENGLEILEKIEDISARLIVNRVSLKTKQESISKIVEALRW
jgi:ATP phosphoribosyltransferase